ncbi:MAG TPA: aromatic amino acid ammonia-lyase [Ornithinimicrobium sp.]|uniref:aromatic amino acid ammonia-lyase n=1 Tax=Ornithinimicrobium sp. TaxID=1977084 RepID=UPI002B465CC5|nr:aromatic amino acid ammonia-lyase [Ornithinimicrobium sp.]HKJ12931.1 aromatic amino acid ammonia-lyase [Ornithinimicrobium sp.]
MDEVAIGDGRLTIGQIRAVAGGARVVLEQSARNRISASRTVIDTALASGRAVYGLNTGVGHQKDVRLNEEQIRQNQTMLLMTHAGGFGPPAGVEHVRAAMMVRLNGLSRGGSGVSPAVAEVLVAMLNAGVHPVVPSTGSVGSGDLGQLAAIGLVAIGQGRAEHAGEVLGGAEALRRAGIEPLVLAAKDGLALMSSNAMSIGHGAHVIHQAIRLGRLADLAAVVSLEAIGGNPEAMLPVVATAKPYPGQHEVCRSVTDALHGSALLEPGGARSVQDPISFRVVPQVHGAYRDAVASTRDAIEIEVNAMSDNPLVSIADQSIVHNGNFHPMVMALSFDAVRPAVAHVGKLSERRMSHLWDAFFERLAGDGGPPSADHGPPEFVGMALRYPAAEVCAELRQLATPATLDVPALESNGTEDHATAAPLAVRTTERALGLLERVVVVELLLARDVLSITKPAPRLGTAAHEAVAGINDALAGRASADAYEAVLGHLRDSFG